MKVCKVCGVGLKSSRTGFCRGCGNKDPERRQKNAEGVAKAHSEGRARPFSEEERVKSHQAQCERKHLQFLAQPLGHRSGDVLRFNLLYSGRPYKCERCSNEGVWDGETLILEIDHIDGDRENNVLTNLRFLCPNCHSLTPTFRNRGGDKKPGRISDAEMLHALEGGVSPRQALLGLRLSLNRDNFTRIRRLQAGV